MDEQRADHVDRLVRVVHRDVDVTAEDELAPGDVLELVDEVAVAVARGDALPLEEAERVRAGRAHAQVVARGRLGDVRAQPPELPVDVGRGLANRRRDLEDGLHQLRADVLVELTVLRGREHRVHVLDEVERLRVEEHVLLLDAERERLARPEVVVEDAAPLGEPLARDGRGINLLHESDELYSEAGGRRQAPPASRERRQLGVRGRTTMRRRYRTRLVKRVVLGPLAAIAPGREAAAVA